MNWILVVFVMNVSPNFTPNFETPHQIGPFSSATECRTGGEQVVSALKNSPHTVVATRARYICVPTTGFTVSGPR